MDILELSHDEARNYFLEGDNFVNFDLPTYFNFDPMLTKISEELADKDIRDYYRQIHDADGQAIGTMKPENYENVNYSLLSNKDGEFAWRPFEIINPVLYVALIHKMTEEANWTSLCERFAELRHPQIACESMPQVAVTQTDDSHKAKQVKRWWTHVEQTSVKLGLKYQYVFDVDVADCYGSIYTHSIAWAMHTKPVMKNNRGDAGYLGNLMDHYIQRMRYGQTNGIPQGSTVMDFIAELVLAYADNELIKLIGERDDYHIVRFRDDYKIFTNNPELGRDIVKHLSQVLSGLGMKLNTSKTKQQSDPITAAIKPDKLYELFNPKDLNNKAKWLLMIYTASTHYPNSGMVKRQLNRFVKTIQTIQKLNSYEDPEVMISIVVNLAIKNPHTYQISMAAISKLLEFCKKGRQVALVKEIRTKFERVPNSGLLDVWLQRISHKIDKTITYDEKLTKLIGLRSNPGNILWNASWLETVMQDLLDIPITNRTTVQKMPTTIPILEVQLFKQVSPFYE
ncbi:MAG: RNA-directed DNA polymerase [Candidatus Saccharimonadales bacterium]